jgi:hypothetical protein
MKQKEAGIYRSEHFHSAGSVHFLIGVDKGNLPALKALFKAPELPGFLADSMG